MSWTISTWRRLLVFIANNEDGHWLLSEHLCEGKQRRESSLRFSLCWLNRGSKQTLIPRTVLTTLMMVAHKLGGKEKAVLISSSIRNRGRGKNQLCQIEKGRNWKNFFLKFCEGLGKSEDTGGFCFLFYFCQVSEISSLNVFSNLICEMVEYGLLFYLFNFLSPGKGNHAICGVYL